MNAKDFTRALLDPTQAVPGALRLAAGQPATKRFAVYRNNIASSLTAALADGFPVVAQLVGEAFFGAMARAYMQHELPTSPVLADWGDGFAAFIDDFPAAATVPYLGDMARLERLRVRAFHAADATPLAPASLHGAMARPATLPLARLTLQPGLGVCSSKFPIAALWAAHQTDGEIVLPDWTEGPAEAALVLRQGSGWTADVAVLPVPKATARFVRALQAGQALKDAAAASDCEACPALDLVFSLGLLITHQLITDWQQADESNA